MLAPLNERIVAPEILPTIAHPDIAVIRPATVDDLDAMVVLAHAMDAVDHPTWQSPREEVEDLVDNSGVDPLVDTLIAFNSEGAAIAFTTVYPAGGAATRVQMYVFGGVHPEYRERGIGSQFVAWGRDRALQRLAEREEALPAWIQVYTFANNADAIAAAEEAGFSVERYFHEMERVLADEIPEIELPTGIELQTFTLEDAERTRLARNDSFRDHWGSQPSQPDKWKRFVEGEIFRADLSVLAVDTAGDRIAAFTLASVNEEDTPLQGYRASYIDLVGVVRDYRGQKLAPAVIAEHLRRARADGCERVTLGVDTASPTGANTLYERLGFTVRDVEVALVIAL